MKEVDPHSPINKAAKHVVSKSRDQGGHHNAGSNISSLVRLPTTQFIGPAKDDLYGKKSGRFTIIGRSAWEPKKYRSNNIRWVGRCSCGRYQILTTKTVKKNHPDNMCSECAKRKSVYSTYELEQVHKKIKGE